MVLDNCAAGCSVLRHSMHSTTHRSCRRVCCVVVGRAGHKEILKLSFYSQPDGLEKVNPPDVHKKRVDKFNEMAENVKKEGLVNGTCSTFFFAVSCVQFRFFKEERLLTSHLSSALLGSSVPHSVPCQLLLFIILDFPTTVNYFPSSGLPYALSFCCASTRRRIDRRRKDCCC